MMLCSFSHMGTNGLEGPTATIFGVEPSAAENINPEISVLCFRASYNDK